MEVKRVGNNVGSPRPIAYAGRAHLPGCTCRICRPRLPGHCGAMLLRSFWILTPERLERGPFALQRPKRYFTGRATKVLIRTL